jgi:predicted aldo/keto reductase-like oxidoreductase
VDYRRFGKTNLSLSIFSLGTMRYLASPENAIATVKAAIKRGINHIETARGYGNSEEYLGQALMDLLQGNSPVQREQLYITTKLPPSGNADEVERCIDESLDRLKVNYLDGLAIHGINTPQHLEWVLDAQGGMQGINQALRDGRVRHLGFSTHGRLDLILATINTDLFEFINLHYYYFFQRNAAAVALAHEKDLGIFIISPADKGGKLHTPPEQLSQLCHPLTPLEFNYQFLLSDPRITTLSLGVANPEELTLLDRLSLLNNPIDQNDNNPIPIPQDTINRLENHATQVLGSDQCSQCYACLPCPEIINIPEILRLRNLAVAYSMTDYGQYRYSMFENAGHWFPGMKGNRCSNCGDCLPRCPEKLNIPALLEDTHDRLKGKSGRRLWG